jgi:hypothetical protein
MQTPTLFTKGNPGTLVRQRIGKNEVALAGLIAM